jgi:predicted RNA-binding Zn ribbon-like protein
MKCQEFDAGFKTRSGWLCLDFANTVDWHASQNPEETLKSYADLIKWAEGEGVIDARLAESLSRLAAHQPQAAEQSLQRARELRETIYRVLTNRSLGKPADPGDLAALNKSVSGLPPHLKLAAGGDCFGWKWNPAGQRLDSLTEPVVWSAAQLLTSEALERVGRCADERGCGWLFWDNSRNQSRRWCDMRDCGNRAKARRHYRKARGTSA